MLGGGFCVDPPFTLRIREIDRETAFLPPGAVDLAWDFSTENGSFQHLSTGISTNVNKMMCGTMAESVVYGGSFIPSEAGIRHSGVLARTSQGTRQTFV
jgi:hypothetical protein